jgi:hypothetical protein
MRSSSTLTRHAAGMRQVVCDGACVAEAKPEARRSVPREIADSTSMQ